ncbi:MAG TPA: ATP-binding protein [Solirubrobacterales bacterium]|nr:ATP-binding protein [Solirubrobacterales bacterium]
MRGAWTGLGLRGRLTLSIGALVLIAFGVVFVFVRGEMADESHIIAREEAREHRAAISGAGTDESHGIPPISDAQEEVERTFLVVGGIALVAALLGGYLIAARTASPLRRMAATVEEVRSGDLTPRLREDAAAAPELRALIAAFNRMLDRLDLAFSQQRGFVSDASHELRTPLTAIRGQLEVLAGGADTSAAEVRRVKTVTIAEVERMERLVDELLELAQFGERSKMETSQVDLAGLLRELAGADTTGIELGELAEGHITGSPELLARVVRNLLANARRHAGGSGRVILSAVATDGRVTVGVDDDGPGIPPGERERVFERFHRIDPARDRDSGGSGLGLAISQEIVEAHAGRIWVEDSALGGARAAFELPGFTSAS